MNTCSYPILYLRKRTDYLVTLSSHLTIPNITPIDMTQTIRNTAQQIQIGHLLYIRGPIQRSRFPTAVAPNHKP